MKRVLTLPFFAALTVGQCLAQVNYSTGFESPTYGIGALAGQDGWTLGSGVAGVGAPAVVGSPAFAGTQSAQLQGNTSGGSFWSISQNFAAGAPSTNTNILTASARIWVDSLAANSDRYFGIGFGLSGAITNGFIGIGLGGTGLRGNGGSYGSYNTNATGLLQSRTVNDFLQRWVGIAMVANRSSATNNVTFTFSNLATAGGNSTESFVRSINFGTANLAAAQMFSDWEANSTTTGSAFVDNVSFGANPVPEPASMTALALGGVALLRRRKKS